MIVHCEKCGTKYTLDDAKVKPGETKVRCSRCQHVFLVPHPLTLNEEEVFGETEEKADDAFLKEWSQGLSQQSPQEPQQPASPAPDTGPPPRAFVPPSAEESPFVKEVPPEAGPGPEEEELAFQVTPVEEAPAKKERKTSSAFLLTVLFLVIVGGALYYWSKMGRSVPAFEYVYEKLFTLMEGQQGQKLFLLYLRGSEYTLDGGKIFAIQGKVANRSQETKRLVKVQGSLFDKAGKEMATSIGFCGVTISDEEIKNSTYDALKSSFGFIGVGQARPVPSQQNLPFTIIFFSPPAGATDYKVDIIETGESR